MSFRALIKNEPAQISADQRKIVSCANRTAHLKDTISAASAAALILRWSVGDGGGNEQ
jgi:hypothetical protein